MRFHGGTLTAVKWYALAAMTAGHVDLWLFGGAWGVHTGIGRATFPLFAFVVGYNLARPTLTPDRHPVLLRRLLLFLAITTVPYTVVSGLLPLNVLSTFAVCLAVVAAYERGREVLGAVLLVVLPLFVDYQWPGVLLVLTVWAAYRIGPGWWWGVAASMLALCLFNGNAWALVAVPMLAVASRVRIEMPRSRWAFYVYYTGHLFVLATVSVILASR